MHFYLQSDIDEICDRLKAYKSLFLNKYVLLTGGNGFLGKYLQAVLTQLGSNIVSVDINKSDLQLKNIDYYTFDVINKNNFNILYDKYKFDYILAAASIASPKIYKKLPILTLDIGFNGVKNCLDLALAHKAQVLCFSSSEIYQTASIFPTPETHISPIAANNERSCYDVSKLVCECLAYNYHKQFNLEVKTVLPFNFYGPQLMDGRVLPSFMQNLVNNLPFNIYDDGRHSRCYTYITDGIVGCLLTLINGKSGEKYNIGNPNTEITVRELANYINYILSLNNQLNIIGYPPDYAGESNPCRRVPDISKAKNDLGFNAQISLDIGIKRFYNWAKENYI